MMRLQVLVGLLCVFSTVADAGVTKGNGGQVVSCKNGRELIVLDAYEAQALHDFKVDQGVLAGNEFAALIGARLEEVGLSWARDWSVDFAEFESILLLAPARSLTATEDGAPRVLPKTCRLRQAVIQRPDVYIVDVEIWRRLSVGSKNVLKLHEVLYRLVARSGVTYDTSRPVRALVGLLISRDFITLSRVDRTRFLRAQGLAL